MKRFQTGARRAVGVRPIQNGFVVLAGEHAALDLGVGDAEKTAAASVESRPISFAEIIVVFGWKFSCGVKADFVQHPPEINEAPDFIVATAQTGNVRHGQMSAMEK